MLVRLIQGILQITEYSGIQDQEVTKRHKTHSSDK